MKTYLYAVDRSSAYLAHYGVKGMKWGIHKAISNYNKRRLMLKISAYSRGRQTLNGGYFQPPSGGLFRKNTNRQALYNAMLNDVEKRSSSFRKHRQDDNRATSNAWAAVGQKNQKAYLKAVLGDAKIPINSNTMKVAHQVISANDKEYARYNKRRSKRS